MKIIYWSGTGNTEEMANLIAKGIEKGGKNSELIKVEDASVDSIKEEDTIVLGCSAMGDEVLEEYEMDPFIESISQEVQGKKVALFGSYGWGDGTWMRNWEERMIGYGAEVIKESLIVNNFPEGEDVDRCIEFGLQLAK